MRAETTEFKSNIFGVYSAFLILMTSLFLTSCGQVSNSVEVTFDKKETQPPASSTSQSPSLGLSVSSQSLTSGAYRLEGSVGNESSPIVKTSGAYTLYGGIQGQVVSQ